MAGAPKHRKPTTHAKWCTCVWCKPPPAPCPCHMCRPPVQRKFLEEQRPSRRSSTVDGGKTAPAAAPAKVDAPAPPPAPVKKAPDPTARLMAAKAAADADVRQRKLLQLMADARAAGHPLTLARALEIMEGEDDAEDL